MRRPALLRALPRRLRKSAWYRLYRGGDPRWLPLYRAARLEHAPRVAMELVPGDLASDCIAFTGVYELPLGDRVVELGRRGGTMIDVGANLGYFALVWAAANPANRVVAIEASPRNVPILRRNVESNGLAGRVQVHAVAAGREPGRMRFDLGPTGQNGWGGLVGSGHGGAPAAEVVEVDVARVDALVPDQPIALLKVDVEGADAWAIEGCDRLLRAKLVAEVRYEQNLPRIRALGIDPDAAQAYLRSVGYEPLIEDASNPEIIEWVATPA